jgi:RNase P subunit RPR2
MTKKEASAKAQTQIHAAPVVCCPSCNSSLRGERAASVRIENGEMTVSFRCVCDETIAISVGPVPAEGRKVEVSLEGKVA